MPLLAVGSSKSKAKISYEVYGSGDNKILFIMGLGAPKESWNPQLRAFMREESDDINGDLIDERFQVCVFDNRGVGLSSAPLGKYSTKRMAMDALELVVHLGWKSFHLVGHSMGGMISLRLSVLLTDLSHANVLGVELPKLSSLFLAVTHYGGPNSHQPSKGRKRMRRLLWSFTDHQYTKVVLPVIYSKSHLSDPEKWKIAYDECMQSRKSKTKAPLKGILGQIAAVSKHRLTSEELKNLRNSQVPIVVMTGDEDLMVDPKNSEELNEILAPVEYIVIKEAGHAINLERSKEFNEAVLRNIERGMQPSIASSIQSLTLASDTDSLVDSSDE